MSRKCSHESILNVPVGRWAFLENDVSRADLGFIDPMLRRRLSPLMRMSLAVAHECAKDALDARFVYASRHGDIRRTTRMLEDIAREEPLSPAMFSLSVLNAVPGLFSVIFGNVAPSTAISAGRSSFGYGLFEAFLQFAEDPSRPVLYVFSDEPLPAVYGEKEAAGNAAHALGLLLQNPAKTWIRCSISDSGASESAELQSRAFLKCLDSGHSDWRDGKKAWAWESENDEEIIKINEGRMYGRPP